MTKTDLGVSRHDSMEIKISAIQESAKKEQDEIVAEISKLESRQKSRGVPKTPVDNDDDDRFRDVFEKMIETRYENRLEKVSKQWKYEQEHNKQLKKQMEIDRVASSRWESNLMENIADLQQRLDESRVREDISEIGQRKANENLLLSKIEVCNLRSLNDKMLEENTTLQEFNEKQELRCEEVTEELNDQAVGWCEQVVTCKDELEKTMKEVQELNILYVAEKAACTTARAELDDIKNTFNSEHTTMCSALAAAEEAASTQTAAALHWNEEALVLKTNNKELTKALRSLREEATILRNSVDQMQSEHSEALHECDEAREARDNPEVQKQVAFSTSAEATDALKHLRESLQSGKQHQLQIEQRRIAEREKYDTELARVREELTTATQAREQLTEQANERVARARRDQKDRETKLKAAHDEELASVQASLNVTSCELDKARGEIKITLRDLACARDELMQTQSELMQVQRQLAGTTEDTQVSTSCSSSIKMEQRSLPLQKSRKLSKYPVRQVIATSTPSASSPRQTTADMRSAQTTATIDARDVNMMFKPALRRRSTGAPPSSSSLLRNVSCMASKSAQPYYSSSVSRSPCLQHLLRSPLYAARNMKDSPRGNVN